MRERSHQPQLPSVVVGDHFSGPLDELLDLIQKHRLPLSVVSLAHITDTYLRQMEHRTVRSLEEMVLVLWIIATLLALKASRLTDAGDGAETDAGEAQELTDRLALLQIIRRLGKQLHQQWGKGAQVRLPRGTTEPHHPSPETALTPDSAITLAAAVERLIQRLTRATERQQFASPRSLVRVTERITLEEAIRRIAAATQRGMCWRFHLREYAREEAIVLFLATLELLRQGVVAVEASQDHTTLTIWGTGERGAV